MVPSLPIHAVLLSTSCASVYKNLFDKWSAKWNLELEFPLDVHKKHNCTGLKMKVNNGNEVLIMHSLWTAPTQTLHYWIPVEMSLSPGIHNNKLCSCSVLHAYGDHNTSQICKYLYSHNVCGTWHQCWSADGNHRQKTRYLLKACQGGGKWTSICRMHPSCLVSLLPKQIQAKLAEM